MKKLAALIALAACAFSASATCIGTDAFSTCTDSSGNSYTVNRIGSTTYLNGSASNGNTWSQTSQTIGGTTFHNGTAANGNSWNGSTMSLPGGMQIHQGTDSRGNSYSKTCTAYGCF